MYKNRISLLKKQNYFIFHLVLSDPAYILHQTGTPHDSVSPKGNCGLVSLNFFFCFLCLLYWDVGIC